MKLLGTVLILCAALLAIEGCAGAATPRSSPEEEIQGSILRQVLARDAIHSIDDPSFVPASEARFMSDEEPVLGLVLGGAVKAYPLYLLERHEVVNDHLGETPVAATW